MTITFHSHALERMKERGATRAEVLATIGAGERFPAKFGRNGFRRNFEHEGLWRGRRYNSKQVEAIVVPEGDGWLVITVVVRYF